MCYSVTSYLWLTRYSESILSSCTILTVDSGIMAVCMKMCKIVCVLVIKQIYQEICSWKEVLQHMDDNRDMCPVPFASSSQIWEAVKALCWGAAPLFISACWFVCVCFCMCVWLCVCALLTRAEQIQPTLHFVTQLVTRTQYIYHTLFCFAEWYFNW